MLLEYAHKTPDELRELIRKNRKNSIILAHNYVRNEVQEIADFIGDSLDLSKKAASTKADRIIFCGVSFMAETAKILSPDKQVLTPEPNAGCPLAACATMEEVLELRAKNPEAAFVAYVNTLAEVKAVVDCCCTSANAVEVVKSFGNRAVVFLPDRNLGSFVKRKLQKDNMIIWGGGCYVHQFISLEDIELARRQFPDWTIIVHPECPPEVSEAADIVASTSGMLKWVSENDKPAIIGTEIGMIERIRREMPHKRIEALKNDALCSNMKQITMAKLARALVEGVFEIELDGYIIDAAQRSLRAMISIG